EFWDRMERKSPWAAAPTPFAQMPFALPFAQPLALLGGNIAAQMMTIFSGVAGYFSPNRALAFGLNAAVGVEQAGFYTIDALHETLASLIDFKHVNANQPRLTVGAVN